MKQVLGLMAAIALLAACDDRTAEDWNGGGEGGGDESPVEGSATASLGDVESATFENGVVTVVVPLDGEDAVQQYTLTGTLNGYDRFDQQETSINRAFTAIAGASDGNELVAIVTMDGGQFNRYLGGATLEQSEFSAPASGFAYFDGDYAGLVNIGSTALSAPPPDTPPAMIPSGVSVVTGSVYLIADFTDNATEGTIHGRNLGVGIDSTALDDVVLIKTGIGGDGTFNGTVELLDLTAVGTYSGAFGGEDAAVAGGIVALGEGAYEGIFPEETDTSNLQEYGLFVIDQCVPAACAQPTP